MSLFPIKDLGELDRRITILEAYTQTDLFGQSVRTWGRMPLSMNLGKESQRMEERLKAPHGCGCHRLASWVITQVWAKVEYMSGKEGEESNRLEAVKRVEFGIRYNSAINEKMQISWDGDIFEIEAVLPIERKRFMHLVTRLVD
jgi:SPP1 family predicted phage head-tail adaptor